MAKADVVACWFLVALAAAAAVLIAAFAFVVPVEVTVDEASVGNFSLTALGNGRPPCFSFDVSLVVAVHNHNWAMRVRRTAPLYAGLCFADPNATTVFVFQLAGEADSDRIRRSSVAVYREDVRIGCFAAPEFARERASGVLELEVIVTGEFMYQAHSQRRGFRLSCPLKLSVSTGTVPAAFARVKCT